MILSLAQPCSLATSRLAGCVALVQLGIRADDWNAALVPITLMMPTGIVGLGK